MRQRIAHERAAVQRAETEAEAHARDAAANEYALGVARKEIENELQGDV
eukprot:SAG11_NODE_4588_length_1841_cov_1.874856_1_plen_49_part_00